jgi:hypothetical protein
MTLKKMKCLVADITSVAKDGMHMYLHTEQENEQKLYKSGKELNVNVAFIKFCC